MTKPVVDLAADLGESFGKWQLGDDRAVMASLSTATLACGFHAGDPVTMQRAVEMALEADISIGAHPGLPDLLGFGRRRLQIEPGEAGAYVLYQAGALASIASAMGAKIDHVKLHGAFSAAATDPDIADAVAAATASLAGNPMIYIPSAPAYSAFQEAADRHGVETVSEFYPELEYGDDGQFVITRDRPPLSVDDVVERVSEWLQTGRVNTASGGWITVDAEVISLHGDVPNAPEVSAAIRARIDDLGVEVRSCGRSRS